MGVVITASHNPKEYCIILVVLPISIGAIILAEPLVRILFQRGKFDALSTDLTSIAL
ncbi:hypothetical protein GSQ54_22165, partial [Clostridioides difficile]|nr:hypothetical protein [Clostridioides difficile]